MSAAPQRTPEEAAAWEQQRMRTVADWAAGPGVEDLIRPPLRRPPGGHPDYPAYWRWRAAESRKLADIEEPHDPACAARYRQDAADWAALAARGTAYLKGW